MPEAERHLQSPGKSVMRNLGLSWLFSFQVVLQMDTACHLKQIFSRACEKT